MATVYILEEDQGYGDTMEWAYVLGPDDIDMDLMRRDWLKSLDLNAAKRADGSHFINWLIAHNEYSQVQASHVDTGPDDGIIGLYARIQELRAEIETEIAAARANILRETTEENRNYWIDELITLIKRRT